MQQGTSDTLGVKVYNQDAVEQPVSSLTNSIEFSFSLSDDAKESDAVCVFWAETEEKWSTDGCTKKK